MLKLKVHTVNGVINRPKSDHVNLLSGIRLPLLFLEFGFQHNGFTETSCGGLMAVLGRCFLLSFFDVLEIGPFAVDGRFRIPS